MKTPIIFFDIGSTLMDGPGESPSSRLTSELGLEIHDRDLIDSFLFTRNIQTSRELIDTFHAHFSQLPRDADQKIARIWQAQLTDGHVIDGAFNILERLVAAGYRLGIISNIWKPYFACFQNLFTQHMDHFKVVILSYETGTTKPDLNIFKRAMAGFGRYDQAQGMINPQLACMVGDSYANDMAPALELGMRTIWILHDQDRERPHMRDVLLKRKPSPDITVPALDELLGDKFKILRTLME